MAKKIIFETERKNNKMNEIVTKIRHITINEINKSDKYKEEILLSLKILLGKSYNKYNFEDIVKSDTKTNINNENFQNMLYKINEKTVKQKNNGVYYTSDDVARYIICNSLMMKINDKLHQTHNDEDCIKYFKKLELEEKEKILYKYKIFDPTCGTGEFLINAIAIKLNILNTKDLNDETLLNMTKTVYGNDINNESIDICKLRIFFFIFEKINNINSCLKLAQIISERFYCVDFINQYDKINNNFDIIVGNPPYVEYGKYQKENNKKLENNYGNIYADILDNSMKMANSNTILGYIIPLSYVSTPRMNKIREIIYKKTEKQFLLNFADRPDSLFSGVHQKLTIIIAKMGEKQKEIFSSNYIHWYKDERKKLLNGREIIEIKKYDISSYIPKIGNELENSIFNKIYTESNDNIYDKQNLNGKKIFLNMRAAFWIKAFSYNPGSNEYKAFSYNEDKYYFILCLLNSNMFWLYWTILSDCWHITTKELKHMKMPDKIKNEEIFEKLYKELEKKLEETKKYIGSKQTSYEYKHKLCKNEIDKIDEYICKIYGLNIKEIEYCRKFALKYRVSEGKND